MAKKKSPAELKEEGEALSLALTAARKKELNFAMLIGKEGIVFETDLRKAPDILWRNGKKAGGGPKGVKGQVRVKGKLVELICDSDDVPGVLVKTAKKHFAERGLAYKFQIITPSGASDDVADEDEDQSEDGGARRSRGSDPAEEAARAEMAEAVSEAVEEAPQEVAQATAEQDPEDMTAGLRAVLQREFDALGARIDEAGRSLNAGAATKVGKLAEMFQAQLGADLKKAAPVLSLLKTSIDAAIAAGLTPADGAGPDPQVIAARMAEMDTLESQVDALLAEVAEFA